jgi:hypothetical protein
MARRRHPGQNGSQLAVRSMLYAVAEPDRAECKGLQGQTRREAGTQSQRSHMDVRWLGRQFRDAAACGALESEVRWLSEWFRRAAVRGYW